MLAGLGGMSINTDTGMTVLRSHWVITPNAAPALNDNVIVGAAIMRNGDIGANITGALTAATGPYQWMFHCAYTFNGGYTRGGGNIITGGTRSRRVIRADQDAFVLSLVSNAAAATQYHLYTRTWVALP